VTAPEEDIQALAEEYLDARNVSFFRIPDEAFKAIHSGTSLRLWDKAKISKYLKGFPDLTIFHPTKVYKNKYPVVLPLELKTEIGTLSPSQESWKGRIGTIVARGWNEVKKEIDEFLDNS